MGWAVSPSISSSEISQRRDKIPVCQKFPQVEKVSILNEIVIYEEKVFSSINWSFHQKIVFTFFPYKFLL